MMSGKMKILSASIFAITTAALVTTVTVARTIHARAELTEVQHTISTGSAARGTVGYARQLGQGSAARGILACGSVRLDCDALENMLAE